MSTGLGDKFYSLYNLLELKAKKFRIPSSVVKLISVSCLEISLILPRVEKFGLIVNG